jgi:PKD repeat protein
MNVKIILGLLLCLFLIAPASAGIPKDLNGDGLYEDLNGNGILDFDDVVTLNDCLCFLSVEKFDFSGDGKLDFEDVVTLYDLL